MCQWVGYRRAAGIPFQSGPPEEVCRTHLRTVPPCTLPPGDEGPGSLSTICTPYPVSSGDIKDLAPLSSPWENNKQRTLSSSWYRHPGSCDGHLQASWTPMLPPLTNSEVGQGDMWQDRNRVDSQDSNPSAAMCQLCDQDKLLSISVSQFPHR